MVPTDVSSYAEVDALVQRTIRELGRLDIVVNNSGVAKVAPLVEMTPEDWRFMLDVNLTGVFNGCRAAGPHLITQKSGKVINVASVLAARVARYMAPYTASKAALVQLTRTLALEWIRYNIQVNALCPGYFLTPMNEEFFSTDAGRRLVTSLPIGRLGDVHEIEGAAVFLASDATSYITGTTLYVDGGHSLA